jgi:formylglycine-generating enzyme
MNRGTLWFGLACAATAAFALAACDSSEPDPEGDGNAGSSGSKSPVRGGAGRSSLQGSAGRDGGGGASGSQAIDGGAVDAASAGSSGASAGSSGASAGSGGSGAGGSAGSEPIVDAATDAAPLPACSADEVRCMPAGRERCEDGEWESAPCPLDQPACHEGECVLRGPTMVRVSSFYVDSTEVTVAQYLAFLNARGSNTEGQPAVCSWNTSFYDGTPTNPDSYPITYVDWCDAHAFCAWAGKRLCGAIEGGALALESLLEPNLSQWSLACGGPNKGSHPNSNSDCNDLDGLAPVGSFTGCEGFYPGLFDLEGNAAEWVDSCSAQTGAADNCYLLGGSYVPDQGYCTHYAIDHARNGTADPFGFRCCSG